MATKPQPLSWKEVLELLHVVDDADTVHQTLLQCHHAFLDLLEAPPRSPEAWQQVQKGQLRLSTGLEVTLTRSDIQQVQQLSEALNLNEIKALELLCEAHSQYNTLDLRLAAGIWHEEQQHWVNCLRFLLLTSLGEYDFPDDKQAAIQEFVLGLLQDRRDGTATLIHRLVFLIQRAQPMTALPLVLDEHGNLLQRAQLACKERRLLCECLLYALVVCPRLPASDMALLLDLLATSARSAGGAPEDRHSMQVAYLVMLSTLVAISPSNQLAGAEGGADESALQQLANDTSLGQKFAAGTWEARSGFGSGYWMAAQLAWAVLRGEQSAVGSSAAELQGAAGDALTGGLLEFLREKVLCSTTALCDEPFNRLLHARLLHSLLIRYLEARNSLGDLEAELHRLGRLASEVRDASAAGNSEGSSLTVQQKQGPKPDTLETLLELLSALHGVYVDLGEDVLDLYAVSPGAGGEAAAGTSEEYATLVDLLQTIAPQDYMHACPALQVAYLDLMRTLVSGPDFSEKVFSQFLANKGFQGFQLFSWKRFFQDMQQVVQRCEPLRLDRRENTADLAAGLLKQDAVPPNEVAVLCSFSRLLARVVSVRLASSSAGSGGAGHNDAAGWLARLQYDSPQPQVPVLELLVQLMCEPVPTPLKAALDDTIAAFVTDAQSASELARRLDQCMLVPGGTATVPGVPLDVTIQLREVAERFEDFVEIIALVNLFNRIWSHCPSCVAPRSSLPDWVRTCLLGRLRERNYRHPEQKWQLAACSLRHMRLTLQAWMHAGGTVGSGHVGEAVLQDLLGMGPAMLTVTRVVLDGMEALEARRLAAQGREGLAGEEAVLEALQLLALAFHVDGPYIEQHNRVYGSRRYSGLHYWMEQELQLPVLLLEYVGYEHSPAIQAAAIQLARHICQRIPDIVNLMLARFLDRVGTIKQGFAQCLQSHLLAGPAQPLEELGGTAALNTPAFADAAMEEAEEGQLVMLVMLLLLETCAGPWPNMAHLLLGYDVGRADGQFGDLNPWGIRPHCLRPLLEALTSPHLPSACPEVFEAVLRLVYHLAADPPGDNPMLRLLRSCFGGPLALATQQGQDDSPQLRVANILTRAVTGPDEGQPSWRVAALYHKALLLQLAALELIKVEPSTLPGDAASARQLLQLLFGSPEPPLAGQQPAASLSADQPQMLALEVLHCLAVHRLQHPRELAAGYSAGVHDEMVNMGLWKLLEQDASALPGVVRVPDPLRGVLVFEGRALKAELERRMQDRIGSAVGGATGHVKEALQTAYRYAIHYNAFVQELEARHALSLAWKVALEAAFTRHFDLLGRTLASDADAAAASQLQLLPAAGSGGGGSNHECLHVLLAATLHTAAALLPSAAVLAALPLCQAAYALLYMLQLQAAQWAPNSTGTDAWEAGKPIAQLQELYNPQRCRAVCEQLVSCILLSSPSPSAASGGAGLRAHAIAPAGIAAPDAYEARFQACAALLTFLQFARGPPLARLPPALLERTLAVAAPPGGASAMVEEMHSVQAAVEAAVAGGLAGQEPRLVSLLVQDALDRHQPPLRRTLVFQLLVALVRLPAGAGPAVQQWVLSSALPQAALEELRTAPYQLLMAHVPGDLESERHMNVVQAQLHLLLALLQSGEHHGKHAAQRLAMAHAVRLLGKCSALQVIPEELPGRPVSTEAFLAVPGISSGPGRGTSRRQLLHMMVQPLLQLLCTLLTLLPDSDRLAEDMASFATEQQPLLLRILADAAHPGASASELEQAQLVVILLSQPGLWRAAASDGVAAPGPAPPLAQAVLRLFTQFCRDADSRPLPGTAVPVGDAVQQSRAEEALDTLTLTLSPLQTRALLRITNLQAALVRFVRLLERSEPESVLRCAVEGRLAGQQHQPTLDGLRRLVHHQRQQLKRCSAAVQDSLDALRPSWNALQPAPAGSRDLVVVSENGRGRGPPQKLGSDAAGRTAALQHVALLQQCGAQLLYSCEGALSTILTTLLKCLPAAAQPLVRPGGGPLSPLPDNARPAAWASPAKPAATGTGADASAAMRQQLGSWARNGDVDRFCWQMVNMLRTDWPEDLRLEGLAVARDNSSMAVIVRQLKGALAECSKILNAT